jgi:predicted ester cyclase
MSAEENKALVRRFNDGIQQFFVTGDVSGLDEICSKDFVHHGPGMPPDLEGFKQMGLVFRAAISDMDVVVEDLIADGDRVVDRITVRGTHTGELMGIPPSGKRFEMQEIHIARIVDGQIVERWTQVDMLGLLQQIGGIPTSPVSA